MDLDRGTSPASRKVKIYYVTQATTAPPTFVLFTNQTKPLHFSYQRFLENRLRDVVRFYRHADSLHAAAEKDRATQHASADEARARDRAAAKSAAARSERIETRASVIRAKSTVKDAQHEAGSRHGADSTGVGLTRAEIGLGYRKEMASAAQAAREIPEKSLFRIGEVSRLTATKAFVLRYLGDRNSPRSSR